MDHHVLCDTGLETLDLYPPQYAKQLFEYRLSTNLPITDAEQETLLEIFKNSIKTYYNYLLQDPVVGSGFGSGYYRDIRCPEHFLRPASPSVYDKSMHEVYQKFEYLIESSLDIVNKLRTSEPMKYGTPGPFYVMHNKFIADNYRYLCKIAYKMKLIATSNKHRELAAEWYKNLKEAALALPCSDELRWGSLLNCVLFKVEIEGDLKGARQLICEILSTVDTETVGDPDAQMLIEMFLDGISSLTGAKY